MGTVGLKRLKLQKEKCPEGACVPKGLVGIESFRIFVMFLVLYQYKSYVGQYPAP